MIKSKYRKVMFKLIIFLGIFQNFLIPNHLRFYNSINLYGYSEIRNFEKIEIRVSGSRTWNLTGSPIFIDDSDFNYNWSLTSSNNDWCNGSGTWNDPYIIENVTIDGKNTDYCICIQNSDKFFTIRNSLFYNAGPNKDGNYGGIKIKDCINGQIINNDLVYNNYSGIFLENSNNLSISNNKINHNYCGIRIVTGDNNSIFENVLIENYYGGVYVDNGNRNNVSKNSIVDSNNGIFLVWSNNNFISQNTEAGNFWAGVILNGSNNNTVIDNFMEGSYDGISLWSSSSNNRISNNQIVNNTNSGLYMDASNCQNNLIYKNYFRTNNVNAIDNSLTENRWDMVSIGNYWDDYSGRDLDDNGIGDTPYYIYGASRSQDNYPIWNDGPEIIISLMIFVFLPILITLGGITYYKGRKKKTILERRKEEERIGNIKKLKTVISDMSFKFTKVKIPEIIEKAGIQDEILIIETAQKMLENKEIFGYYENKSKSIIFDHEGEVEEIDRLIEKYEEWEEKEPDKKKE